MNDSSIFAGLKEKYPSLAVIEVWETVLFLRMSQGRCVFHSKKGTVFANLPVGTWLLAAEQPAEARAIYKQMAIKLHPDKRSGSHEKFLKLKHCYENHEAIRARLGANGFEFSESYYYEQRERAGWFRDAYGSYEEYVERRREQDEYARKQVEELGVPF